MDIKEQKAELRREIRRQRRKLDKDERLLWDRAISDSVLSLDEYKNAKTVFCFVSYGGEPETREIIKAALRDGKRVTVPRCREEGQMDAVEIKSLEGLVKSDMGIMEPAEGLPVTDFGEIDFAVVPALAFTPDGKRLGQGGGYYDRFMAATPAFTCGICYRQFVLEDIPCESFDRNVRKVICG